KVKSHLFLPHNVSMWSDVCIAVPSQLGQTSCVPKLPYIDFDIINLLPLQSLQVITVFGTLVKVNSLSGVHLEKFMSVFTFLIYGVIVFSLYRGMIGIVPVLR